MSGADPCAGIGKTVVPVEDFMDTEGFDSVVAPITHPSLPNGDIIFFGKKDSGKTATILCALLAWGYKFGHIVFCCPHVDEEKLAKPKDKSVAKYKVLQAYDHITLIGMKTDNDADEAHEKIQEAFDVLREKKDECDGQLLLVLDDMAAFLCYGPIKTTLTSEWVNLKHLRAYGW